MGLISTEVEVKVNAPTIKYYKSCGYKCKIGEIIIVKIEHLQLNSGIKVKVKCDCCEREYEMTYQKYNKHNHDSKIYCHKCANKILNSGENHWNYDINKTDEEREKERDYPEYTEFIKKVLTRDNYTCQCCGKYKTYCEIHHLDGYDWDIEHRTDETNGITLCKSCHKNFHLHYGYGNNTKEQFKEWIGKAIDLVKYEGKLPTTRKIYCIEEDKIYDSAIKLADILYIKSKSKIYDVCNHKKQKNGSYCKSIRGKHYLWLDEYEQMSEEDLKRYLDWCNDFKNKKIKCITTGKEFNTIKEACEFYGIKNQSSMTQYFKRKQKYLGIDKNTGKKLEWIKL